MSRLRNVKRDLGARDLDAYEKRMQELDAQRPLNAGDQSTEIEALNRKHAVVQYGGRVLILTEVVDPVLNRRTLAFSSATEFRLKYCNRRIDTGRTNRKGEPIINDLGSYWIGHPKRRQYEGIVFDPRETPDGYLNIWTGFSVQPKPGDCTLYKQHLREVICRNDPDKFRYLWLWLAHLVQRPWELPEIAVVMRSKQGTGKDTMLKPFARIFGRHYAPLTQPGLLAGRFTAHLMEAILVFANEAVWGGDKSSEGKLKAMITDGIEMVEGKGKDAIAFPNYKRIIAASNEYWAVPRGIDDRRFFCLDVSEHRIGDSAYFTALNHEIEHGGTEALLHELLQADIREWHPRHNLPAGNTDGEDMKIESATPTIKFLYEALSLGTQNLVPDPGAPPEHQFHDWRTELTKQAFFDCYTRWCDSRRVQYPDGYQKFTREANRAFALGAGRPRDSGTRVRTYLFPPLEGARRQFQTNVAFVTFDGECDRCNPAPPPL